MLVWHFKLLDLVLIFKEPWGIFVGYTEARMRIREFSKNVLSRLSMGDEM
jgi:hypothetical protein